MPTIMSEFYLFLKQEQRWWLVPMLSVMAIMAALVFFAVAMPALAPFIYTTI